MKSGSRTSLTMIGVALCIALGAAVTSQAQNREKYLISASAGGINFVSGNVTVIRKRSNRQSALTLADDLRSGDTVTTGPGGRVEVLLNPGSYMRVDENSEFVLSDASLDNLMVKLVKGSVVVEVTADEGVDLALRFETPETEAVIVRGGIYRFNVLASQTTEILVRKGRLYYGKPAANELKGGRRVSIGHGRADVAKMDKKDQDSLDIWSKDRAELLAKANRRLSTRSLLTAYNSFNSFGWNDVSYYRRTYDSVGVWVFNPTVRTYCFLPYGWRAGSSPYGHSFGTGVGYPGGSERHWGGGGSSAPGGNGNGGGSTGVVSGTTGSSGGNGGGSGPSPAPQPISQPAPMPSMPSMREAQTERPSRQDYRTNN